MIVVRSETDLRFALMTGWPFVTAPELFNTEQEQT